MESFINLIFSFFYYRKVLNRDKESEKISLPADWELRHSSSRNRPYYYNRKTGESRWEEPPESSATHSSNEVRVKHILVKHVGNRRPSSWKQVSEFEMDHRRLIVAYRIK